jgi:hypothetical protein
VFVLVSVISYWNYSQKNGSRLNQLLPDPGQYLSLQTRSIPSSDAFSTVPEKLNLFYLDEDYQSALNLIQDELKFDSTNTSLHYYAGLLNLELEDHERAEHHLQYVRMNSALYYKSALQFLALINIKANKNQKAVLLLQDHLRVASPDESMWTMALLKEITPH